MIALVFRILRFAGAYGRRLRLAFVFSLLKALLASAPVGVGALVIARLLEGTLTVPLCGVLAVALLAALGLQALCQYGSDRLQSSAGFELFADKRVELGEHLRRLPMGYYTAGNVGQISSVLSADMVFIEEQCMMMLADFVSDFFTQAILTGFLFWLHPCLGLTALAVEAVSFVIAYFMNKTALKDSRLRQQSIQDLNASIIEHAEGIGVIKSFNLGGARSKRLRRSFAQMTTANLKFETDIAPWFCALFVLFGLGSAAILAVSLWLHDNGSLELFAVVAVLLFLFSLFNPLRHVYGQCGSMTIMQAALDRFERLMAEPELHDEGTTALPEPAEPEPHDEGASAWPEPAEPEIEFRDVSFAYEDENVLSDVSFKVAKGQMCALVGPSGSGKTTIASLLCRFWDVSSGQVLVRGQDVRDVPLSDLVDQMSLVFQRVYLFQDTVHNNILLGRGTATAEEVHEAARKARCHDFIMSLPYGYDTVIGEGGATLSSGEAQRLSIARCILKDAPIVVLDEATASVDPDNERVIQQALSELCRGKTLLVIAHQLSTIREAQQILVIEDGRVRQRGAHAELMAEDGRYRDMTLMQDQVISWCDPEATPAGLATPPDPSPGAAPARSKIGAGAAR